MYIGKVIELRSSLVLSMILHLLCLKENRHKLQEKSKMSLLHL